MEHKINIFHIVHVAQENSALFKSNSNEVEIVKELEAMPSETVIKKTIPNSFYKTNLYEQLKLTRKKQLIIMGFASHMCVTATTIAAFELGFENFVLADCCASRNLPFFEKTISATTIHKSSMALLGDRYATVINSEDILNLERNNTAV